MHEEAEHQRDSSGVAAPPAAVVCETKNRVVSVLEYPVSKTPISIVGGTTEGGIITVAVASAMFKRKGEDYATVCRSTEEEPKLRKYPRDGRCSIDARFRPEASQVLSMTAF